jgi:hypothetical protein
MRLNLAEKYVGYLSSQRYDFILLAFQKAPLHTFVDLLVRSYDWIHP